MKTHFFSMLLCHLLCCIKLKLLSHVFFALVIKNWIIDTIPSSLINSNVSLR
jgi:hypothetical protein